MLIIEVWEIREKCPVYKKGDKIVIDGPEIVLEKNDAICIHALAPQTLKKFDQNASLLHYFAALREGVDPVELGLSKSKDEKTAYIQCLDPGEQTKKLSKLLRLSRTSSGI